MKSCLPSPSAALLCHSAAIVLSIALAAPQSRGGHDFEKQELRGSPEPASSVALGDADQDGALDLLVASRDENAVALRLAVTAAFSEIGELKGAADAIFADLDGDGDLDIAAAGAGGDTIDWWENQPPVGGYGDPSARPPGFNATWQPHSVAIAAVGVASLAVADIDKDGDLDLLAGEADGGEIAWYENRLREAAGNWERHRIARRMDCVAAVAAADIDGDGWIDAVAAAEGTREVAWFRGGDQPQWTKTTVEKNLSGAAAVGAADLDRDGDLDIYASGESKNRLSWFQNENGGTRWRTLRIADRQAATAIAATDLDEDGAPDLIVSPQVTENLTAWLNRLRERGPWKPERITANVQNVADIEGADLDGDGDPDLATAGNGGAIYWLNPRPPQEARFRPAAGIASASGAADIAFADIDRDGDLDAVVAGENGIVWRENLSRQPGQAAHIAPRPPSGWREHAIAASFRAAGNVIVADIDGDGDPDVAAAAPEEGDLAWFANPRRAGASWEQVAITDTAKGASQLAAADFDQDGDLDFAASFTEDGTLRIWENPGITGGKEARGDWVEVLVDAQAHGLKTLHAADFDADGHPDLAGVVIDPQSADGGVVWWHNPGAKSAWERRTIDASAEETAALGSADLDNDGDLDVFAALPGKGEIVWWEQIRPSANAADRQWSRRTVAAGFVGAQQCEAADADRDGDLDLIASGDGSGITLFANPGLRGLGADDPGKSAAWEPETVDAAASASAIALADLDQNGTVDIGAIAGDKASWYPNAPEKRRRPVAQRPPTNR